MQMRFFLEFVSCCGSPRPALRAEEEERSLVPAPVVASRPLRRKKRGRMGGPDWRPSLGSISEDNVLSPRESGSPRNGSVVPGGRDVKRRSSGAAAAAGAAKVRHRSYSDGYYVPATMTTMMPAFSPTPFMF